MYITYKQELFCFLFFHFTEQVLSGNPIYRCHGNTRSLLYLIIAWTRNTYCGAFLVIFFTTNKLKVTVIIIIVVVVVVVIIIFITSVKPSEASHWIMNQASLQMLYLFNFLFDQFGKTLCDNCPPVRI